MTLLRLLGILTIILSFLGCANPIEKKKKELKNLNVTLKSLEIVDFNMLLLPPVPKISFLVTLSVENTNDVSVTIDTFELEVFKKNNKRNVQLAKVISNNKVEIKEFETKELFVDLNTLFEKNPSMEMLKFLKDLVVAMLKNQEIEYLIKGLIHVDTIFGKLNIPIEEVRKVKARL